MVNCEVSLKTSNSFDRLPCYAHLKLDIKFRTFQHVKDDSLKVWHRFLLRKLMLPDQQTNGIGGRPIRTHTRKMLMRLKHSYLAKKSNSSNTMISRENGISWRNIFMLESSKLLVQIQASITSERVDRIWYNFQGNFIIYHSIVL